MTESSASLTPCPFCGGEATFDHDDAGWNWIECKGCGASTNARVSAMDDCKPLLLEQWNRRAAVSAPVPSDAHEQGLWLRDLFANIEKWNTIRDGTPSKAEAWKKLWDHAHNIGPHWRARALLQSHAPDADLLRDLQPLETVRYWADALAKDPQGLAGGMIVKLLNEYAELRARLEAKP